MKLNTRQSARPCPSSDEITHALEVLDNQFLHVYQLLFFNGLTNPYPHAPLMVERKYNEHGVNRWITVSVPNNLKGLSFETDGTDDVDILMKAQMLLDAKDKFRPMGACCPYAKPMSCVCHKSFTCPIHGETHIGSHE